MARPVKSRIVCSEPKISIFGPEDYNQSECIYMSLEEFETIRLIDYKNLTQEETASLMAVARTTVQGIYADARKKLADVLVNGKKIKIEGGNYSLCAAMPLGKYCNRKNCKRYGN
ncbi:MAG: DUF134 domain-containing protein [Bacilli bacterium]|nr:DUF134 domain-containing protein [Bacilli bacterium]MDD4644004.1 DUF134 domain-containing protein [Bacilli bacterium]